MSSTFELFVVLGFFGGMYLVLIHLYCCSFSNLLIHSYIDTVGMPDAYRRKLERVFEGKGITFVVEKKADAKYAPCSAASVGESCNQRFLYKLSCTLISLILCTELINPHGGKT